MDIHEHIERCEELYRADKQVIGPIEWCSTRFGARFEALVSVSTGGLLTLKGIWSRERHDIKLELYYKKTYPIRRFHSHYGHYNPGSELVDGPHKHKPTEEYCPDDPYAYAVNDIQTEDPNRALYGFLSESKIMFLGSYQGIL